MKFNASDVVPVSVPGWLTFLHIQNVNVRKYNMSGMQKHSPFKGFVPQTPTSGSVLDLARGSTLSSPSNNFWTISALNVHNTSAEASWSSSTLYTVPRWSLWTLAVTFLAWHSICHTPQPALFRATAFGGMQHTFSQMNKLYILQGSAVTFFRCGG